MRTIEQIKEDHAKKLHYKDWSDLLNKQSKHGIETTMGEVAEILANERTEVLQMEVTALSLDKKNLTQMLDDNDRDMRYLSNLNNGQITDDGF